MSTKWLSSRSFKAAVLLGVALTVYKAGKLPDKAYHCLFASFFFFFFFSFFFCAKVPSWPSGQGVHLESG